MLEFRCLAQLRQQQVDVLILSVISRLCFAAKDEQFTSRHSAACQQETAGSLCSITGSIQLFYVFRRYFLFSCMLSKCRHHTCSMPCSTESKSSEIASIILDHLYKQTFREDLLYYIIHKKHLKLQLVQILFRYACWSIYWNGWK
jgi:hypothetical protein